MWREMARYCGQLEQVDDAASFSAECRRALRRHSPNGLVPTAGKPVHCSTSSFAACQIGLRRRVSLASDKRSSLR
jgi:hypothetical protein